MMWLAFSSILLLLIFLDLSFRKAQALSLRQALVFSAVWIAAALFFNAVLIMLKGWHAGLQFFTGYIIELTLSIDNLFVFLVLFQSMQIPAHQQPRILFWGIMGALLFRLLFIIAGIALVTKFHWIMYLFGGFLIATSLYHFKKQTPQISFKANKFKRWLPLYEGEAETFFIRKESKLYMTKLFLTLLMIEGCDLMFALDSIPAIFGITQDPFIIFSSNACAIAGLRSLYFVVQHMLRTFSLLHYGVCIILFFIGCKMLIEPWYTISIAMSLCTIAAIIIASVGASLWYKQC